MRLLLFVVGVLVLQLAVAGVEIPIIAYILNVSPEILGVDVLFSGGSLVVDVRVRDNNTIGDVWNISLPWCVWRNGSGFMGNVSRGSAPASYALADGVWRFVCPFSGRSAWVNVSVFDENLSNFFSRLFVDRVYVLGSRPSSVFEGGSESVSVVNLTGGVRWKFSWTVSNVLMEVVRWRIPVSGWSLVSSDDVSATFRVDDLTMLVNWSDVSSYPCRFDYLFDEAILAVYLPTRRSVLVLDPEITITVSSGSSLVPKPPPSAPAVSPPRKRDSGSGGIVPFGSSPFFQQPRSSLGFGFFLFVLIVFLVIGVVIVLLFLAAD